MPRVRIQSETVEFLRFGPDEGLLAPETEYIRAQGFDRALDRVHPTRRHREVLHDLRRLRYTSAAAAAETAKQALAEDAGRFLPSIEATGPGLTQVDVVTKAAELWVVPLEASYAAHPSWLADVDSGVVITRRIRGGFTEDALPWPERPRLLFAHAPPASDLAQELIDRHAEVLRQALEPWSGGDLLQVVEVASIGELSRARKRFAPSYIHLLAHGAKCANDPTWDTDPPWGLRLGGVREPGIPPAEIARVLAPDAGVPLVVTVAACDSANAEQILFAHSSVVQELHRLGVPVVVGSQLPLTKIGSVTFTEAFYRRLLCGQDVRLALHAGRLAVRADPRAGHDWLSLVGYVRLPPEGYGRYLMEFGLRAELGMLNAQQRRMDELIRDSGPRSEFDAVEARTQDRIRSLEHRRDALDRNRGDLLDECRGLLASAGKRLAELQFRRAELFAEHAAADLESSRATLENALDLYREAYQRNIQSHWTGIQALALEAVLHNRFRHPDDWSIVLRAAELERDAYPARFWPCGTLAEIWLLASIGGRVTSEDPVQQQTRAIRLLVQRAQGQRRALETTRRQLGRYVTWWTHENGFFPGGPDLSSQAGRLITLLDDAMETS